MSIKNWDELYDKVINVVPKLHLAHGFRKWLKDNESDGYLFDPMLIARSFKIYKDMIKIDRDHFTLIVGGEGSGKSTLAIQLACWIDPNFSQENICFSLKEYINIIKTAKKGSCILLDEGGITLYSREVMNKENIKLTKLFMLQRQRNLSVIVCCPSFWDVDTYIRRHRINTMIRVISQGKYQGYLPKAIQIINEVGYRKKPLTTIKLPNGSFWHGWFLKKLPGSLNRKAYLSKKKDHFNEFLKEIEAGEAPQDNDRSTIGVKPKQMDQMIKKAKKDADAFYNGNTELKKDSIYNKDANELW